MLSDTNYKVLYIAREIGVNVWNFKKHNLVSILLLLLLVPVYSTTTSIRPDFGSVPGFARFRLSGSGPTPAIILHRTF